MIIMKLRLLIFNPIILFVTLSAVVFSCSEDSKTARLNIRLTDAPGDFEEVNVDIQEVKVHASGGDQENGWKSLDITAGVYNLLEFTNGLDTLLGSIELPAGKVSQIRLVLGSNNSIKVDVISQITYPFI